MSINYAKGVPSASKSDAKWSWPSGNMWRVGSETVLQPYIFLFSVACHTKLWYGSWRLAIYMIWYFYCAFLPLTAPFLIHFHYMENISQDILQKSYFAPRPRFGTTWKWANNLWGKVSKYNLDELYADARTYRIPEGKKSPADGQQRCTVLLTFTWQR